MNDLDDAIRLLKEALQSEHLTMYVESRIRSALINLELMKREIEL